MPSRPFDPVAKVAFRGSNAVTRSQTAQPVTVIGLEHAGRFHVPTNCLGGSERIALLTLEELRRRGFRVLLACPGDTSLARAASERGIAVRPFEFLPMRRTRNVRELGAYLRSVATLGLELRRLCRREQVQVVHAFSLITGLYALVATGGTRVHFLLHAQDAQTPHWPRRAALRLISRRATRLICVSRAVQEMLTALGVPAQKLVLVYNAVEPRFLAAGGVTTDEVSGAGPHVGLFAHIIPWKGQQVFLDAAALLAPRFPTARFYLVGGRLAGVSDAYCESLRARADKAPLAGRVEITGARTDVASWMAAMDVVVHTSVAPEAFGLVIAEGMALGKPVVAADCGAPRELVRHGETGYLSPAGDARALARVLEHVLERGDPDVGHRAAAVSRRRFGATRFGDELERVYRAVLGEADRPRAS